MVNELKRQADGISGLQYEIIVADDGSRDQVCIIHNYLINELEHCRYIRRKENVGRAKIRNYLASESKGDWLLFMDSDVCIVSDDYLQKFIEATKGFDGVIDGGVSVVGNPDYLRHNLRFWYEYVSAPKHTAGERQKHPYHCARTTNLLVSRNIFRKVCFDERFRYYGYEDVMFGKKLSDTGTSVLHIDNAVGLSMFETNESFLLKTEEAMHTLHLFADELAGYSRLLNTVAILKRRHLIWAVRLWHRLLASIERDNLLSKNPSLFVFKIYKLGFYISLT